jgi:SOS response regulatory protein OraA/RecX
LDEEFVEDLKRQLKEMGYSEEAIVEILKWYHRNNS